MSAKEQSADIQIKATLFKTTRDYSGTLAFTMQNDAAKYIYHSLQIRRIELINITSLVACSTSRVCAELPQISTPISNTRRTAVLANRGAMSFRSVAQSLRPSAIERRGDRVEERALHVAVGLPIGFGILIVSILAWLQRGNLRSTYTQRVSAI